MNYIPDFPIIGIDRITNFVQDRKGPYWVIYDSDKAAASSSQGRKTIADNLSYDDETVDNAVRRLRAFLNDFQETGFVGYLWCKEKANATSGGYYTAVKISSTINQPVAGIGAFPQQPVVDIQAEIEKALEGFKTKQRLEELEKENKELRALANQETAVDRVVTRLEPFIEPMIKGIFSPGTPAQKVIPSVAGTPKSEIKEDAGSDESDEATKIAMGALQVLADGDDELHLKLQKLADMKTNNPEGYAMALTFLT
jgi:hypothetical protein